MPEENLIGSDGADDTKADDAGGGEKGDGEGTVKDGGETRPDIYNDDADDDSGDDDSKGDTDGDDDGDDGKSGDDDGDKDDKDDKDGDDDKPEGAPEKYEAFDLPEGVKPSAELLAAAEPVFRDLNLTQEQAQKLVDLQVAQVEGDIEAHTKQSADWAAENKNDKELGGDNYPETVRLVRLATNEVGQELKDFVNQYGIGNAPPLVKALRTLGQALDEDKLDGGRAGDKGGKSGGLNLDSIYTKTPEGK